VHREGDVSGTALWPGWGCFVRSARCAKRVMVGPRRLGAQRGWIDHQGHERPLSLLVDLTTSSRRDLVKTDGDVIPWLVVESPSEWLRGGLGGDMDRLRRTQDILLGFMAVAGVTMGIIWLAMR